MKSLIITWADVFDAIAVFFQWIFKGMRVLGQGPNVVIWILIVGILAYWTMRLVRYRREAHRNGTLE